MRHFLIKEAYYVNLVQSYLVILCSWINISFEKPCTIFKDFKSYEFVLYDAIQS